MAGVMHGGGGVHRHGGGGVHSRGEFVVGGRGACIAGGCMEGDMHGRIVGYCSGWYAPYWNAFLFEPATSCVRRHR